MKTVAVIGAAAGTTGLLQSCGSSSGATGQKEVKTLYFDHSHLKHEGHDFYLVVGNKHHNISPTNSSVINSAKASNSFLNVLPSKHITHYCADVELPADNVQLCYIKKVAKTKNPKKDYTIAGMFIHCPQSSLQKAHKRRDKEKKTYVSAKAKHYKIDFTHATASNLLDESAHVGASDSATSIVFMSPEVMSLDADSATHIQENIIKQQGSTVTFSQAIQYQGDGWATYKTVSNPATGKSAQMPVYSDMTMQFAGSAILDSMNGVKQDNSLYANVSNITDPSQMKGKICTVQDGQTYSSPNTAKSVKGFKGGSFSYTLSDVCTGGGYKLELDSIKSKNNDIVAKFMCKNSYLRHLGMFVRYLDANNQPIPISSIPSSFFSGYPNSFTLHGYDTTYHKFLKVVGPEWMAMGVPVHAMVEDLEVPLPPIASKMQIFGNTLGHGDDQYNNLGVGITLTAVFDIAIPSIFLMMGAGTGYAAFQDSVGVEDFLEALEIFGELLTEIVACFGYADAKAFANLGIEIGQKLLLYVTKKLVIKILAYAAIAEAEDAIPIVGAIMNAIGCAATAADLSQTTYACLNSPWNYIHTLAITHNVTITINHDPNNPEGFPSVATYFILTATCKLLDSSGNVIDSSTPIQVRQQMPSTTRTAPIVVTLNNLPYGGYIALAVGFYSDTGWLAGNATLKDGDNTQSSFSLTIKQNQVPLTSSTTYSHKEKMTLDSSGNHVWTATTTVPKPTPLGQCGQSVGQLCQIIDITDSNTFASVGYVWQSYSQSSGGQMYYIGNVSTTDTPQSSSMISVPMTAQTRIVYDLMGGSTTQRNFYLDVASGNIIRQIRLGLQSKPSYDAPNSNIAWGRLNFSSDALLLHPNNKIISINASLSKIEVLSLPEKPTTDKNAPLASTYAGPGIREGLLNGPLCSALTPKGEILILEASNNRIQAFDTGGNPVKVFSGGTSYFAPLQYSASEYHYLDMAAEYSGYIYLLCYKMQGTNYVYYLDIYKPDGSFLARTSNFSGAKIVVSYWRDVFAGNMEVLRLPNGNLPSGNIAEPSISRWIPSTP